MTGRRQCGWRRRLARGLAPLLLAADLGCPRAPGAGRGPAPVPREDGAVYAAVVDSLFLRDAPPPRRPRRLVMTRRTSSGAYGRTSLDDLLERLRTAVPDLPPSLVEHYRAVNATPALLRELPGLDVTQVLIDSAAAARVFDAPEGVSAWARFYLAYPGAQGLLTLSRVGFDDSGTWALVCASNYRDWEDATGDFVLLRRERGAWRVWKRVPMWIS